MSTRNQLYFNALPDAGTEHIVNLLLPQSELNEDRSDQFSVETVVALVESGGSLRRAAQNAFRIVQFSVGQDSKKKSGALQVRSEHKEVDHLLKAIPIVIGKGIETMFFSAPLAYAFARAVAKHCTGLRNLSFNPSSGRNSPIVHFCAILTARGSDLESLDISDFYADDAVVSAIAESCQGLLRLKLECPRVLCSLAPLWTSLSKKLQLLEIVGADSHSMMSFDSLFANRRSFPRVVLYVKGRQVFEAIFENCPGLRKLSFVDMGYLKKLFCHH